MSMYDEVSKLEEYAIDLERHIKHLEQWYVDDEHRDLKMNRALLTQVKEDLERLVNECRRKHDERTCDDSFRFCGECDSIIGEGYVLNDEAYCSQCFYEQHTEQDIERMFGSDEAYWTAWY